MQQAGITRVPERGVELREVAPACDLWQQETFHGANGGHASRLHGNCRCSQQHEHVQLPLLRCAYAFTETFHSNLGLPLL